MTLSSVSDLPASRYQNIAVWLWSVGLFASIAWVGAYDTEFFIVMTISLLAALLASDLAGVATRVWTAPFSATLVVGGLFWLNVIRSAVQSDTPMVAWGYLVCFSFLPLSVLFFLIGRNLEARLLHGFKSVVAFAAVLGVYAVWQYIFARELLTYGRVRLPFADANALGAVFSYGVFAGVGWFSLGLSLQRKTQWALVFTALCFAGLLATGSRGALLMLGIFGLVYVIATRGLWLGPLGRKWLGIGAGVALVLVVASVVLAPNDATGVYQLLNRSLSGELPLLGERVHIWQSTLAIIHDYFWTGTGIGTFFLYYPQYRSPLDQSAGFMAHNDILQFTAETGIAAPVLIALFMMSVLWRTLKALRGTDTTNPQRIIAMAALCGFLAMVSHTQVTFNFYVLPLLVIAGFALAVWYYATAVLLREKFVTVNFGPGAAPRGFTWVGRLSDDTLKACILIPGILVILLAIAPPVSQRMAQQAWRAAQNGDITLFSHFVNWSDRIVFGLSGPAYLSAATVPLGVLATHESIGSEDKIQLTRQAQSLLDRAKSVNPRLASIYFYEGWLANLTAPDAEKGAAEITKLQEALALDPQHLPSRQRLVELLQALNRTDEAKAVIRQGLPWIYGGQNPFPFYKAASFIALQERDTDLFLEITQAETRAKNNAAPYVINPMGKALRDIIARPQSPAAAAPAETP